MSARRLVHTALALVLLACASEPDASVHCPSGMRLPCRCASGEHGYAVCEGGEHGYGACLCGTAETDGAVTAVVEASTDDAGANSAGGALGSGGALASGGATGVGGTSGSGGIASTGGNVGCGADGNCGAAPGASGASAVAPDGSNCGAPVNGWCPPGCIRLFGDRMDSPGKNDYGTAQLAACVQSCVDGTATTTLGTLLSDGTCWNLDRVCDEWSSNVARCVYKPANGITFQLPRMVSLGGDGGNPCALTGLPPAPFVEAAMIPILGGATLHERASLDDCGSREGYYVDWSTGNPTLVLCAASCGVSDAGRPLVSVEFW